MKRIIFAIILLAGCDDHSELHVMTMRDQPAAKSQEESHFFADRSASRDWPDHVVPWDSEGSLTAARPVIDLGLLTRGQQRFAIHCAMCHGDDGAGEGIVADHGFPRPPSFHSDHASGTSDAAIYEVILSGRGKMPPYRDQVSFADRWAIVAYVRSLQKSQRATIQDVPESLRASMLETQHPLPADVWTNQP